jgi:hypothetical protein
LFERVFEGIEPAQSGREVSAGKRGQPHASLRHGGQSPLQRGAGQVIQCGTLVGFWAWERTLDARRERKPVGVCGGLGAKLGGPAKWVLGAKALANEQAHDAPLSSPPGTRWGLETFA